MGCKAAALQRALWGDFAYQPKTKRIVRIRGELAGRARPLFVQLALEPIWKASRPGWWVVVVVVVGGWVGVGVGGGGRWRCKRPTVIWAGSLIRRLASQRGMGLAPRWEVPPPGH